MRMRITSILVSIVALFLLGQAAALAAETMGAAQPKPKYKKITGEVVSASPASIVIKNKTKDALTLAVTDKTKVIGGKTAKAGDRAVVNYRVDKNGNTATRIEVLAASAKPSKPKPPAVAPAPQPQTK